MPKWKQIVYNFNLKYLSWLNRFVTKIIPSLILLLVIIVLGEYSHYLNFFHWEWMEKVAEFFHHYEHEVTIIDNIIIGFLALELYFVFFKKSTFVSFVKSSFLEIIAVAPLGFMARFFVNVEDAQQIIHVSGDIEKEASKLAREGRLITRSQRLWRFFARIPRMLRLYRISDFFRRKIKRK